MDEVNVSKEAIDIIMPKIRSNIKIAIEPITTPSGENTFWNMWKQVEMQSEKK